VEERKTAAKGRGRTILGDGNDTTLCLPKCGVGTWGLGIGDGPSRVAGWWGGAGGGGGGGGTGAKTERRGHLISRFGNLTKRPLNFFGK